MTIHLIHHADVIRPIRNTLRSFGVRAQDLPDGIAEVQTRTLEYLMGKAVPADIEAWVALCTTIARNWRLNEKERRETEQKYSAGLCEDPDEYVGIEPPVDRPDAVDARRMVAVLQAQFDADEMPDKGDEVLDCVQAGMNYQRTGAELGLSPETVRKRLIRMREVFERRLAELGMMTFGLVVVMLATGPALAANRDGFASPPTHVPVRPPRNVA